MHRKRISLANNENTGSKEKSKYAVKIIESAVCKNNPIQIRHRSQNIKSAGIKKVEQNKGKFDVKQFQDIHKKIKKLDQEVQQYTSYSFKSVDKFFKGSSANLKNMGMI